MRVNTGAPHPAFGHLLPPGEGVPDSRDTKCVALLPPGEGGRRPDEGHASFAAPLVLLAHAGHHHLEPAEVLTWWSWEPVVVTLLALTALLYFGGVWRLWRAAGIGRGVGRLPLLAFATGWLALVV